MIIKSQFPVDTCCFSSPKSRLGLSSRLVRSAPLGSPPCLLEGITSSHSRPTRVLVGRRFAQALCRWSHRSGELTKRIKRIKLSTASFFFEFCGQLLRHLLAMDLPTSTSTSLVVLCDYGVPSLELASENRVSALPKCALDVLCQRMSTELANPFITSKNIYRLLHDIISFQNTAWRTGVRPECEDDPFRPSILPGGIYLLTQLASSVIYIHSSAPYNIL